MATGEILFTKHGGVCFIKLVGDIRYTVGSLYMLSRSLDVLLDRLFANRDFGDVLIDMSQTECIDSTNLGLLARIAIHAMDTLGRRPTIVSTNPDITRILESMGCDRVFLIVEDPPPTTPGMTRLEGMPASEKDRLGLLLSAHRNLMTLSAQNHAQFRDIVELLERDLDAFEARQQQNSADPSV